MCPPGSVTPEVEAELRRCADCPSPVWVAAVLAADVLCGLEPLCFSCALRVIRASSGNPRVEILPQFEEVLRRRGKLEWARDQVSRFSADASELEAYAAGMEERFPE